MENHLLNVCSSSNSEFEYLPVQLIEILCTKWYNIDRVLLEIKKYWQTKLFILSHRLNNLNDMFWMEEVIGNNEMSSS